MEPVIKIALSRIRTIVEAGSIPLREHTVFKVIFKKTFRNLLNINNSFQIYVASLKDTLKGRVAALKLAKLSNVLFMPAS